MTFLERLQNKPHHVKIKLIFTIVGGCAVVLLVLWWFLHKDLSDIKKDTTLMDTLNKSFEDVSNNWDRK